MPIYAAGFFKRHRPLRILYRDRHRRPLMNHPVQLAAIKRPVPESLLTALRSMFGERLSVAQAMRDHHGRDESSYDQMPPDAVVFAHSTEEVAAAVKQSGRHAVPNIAYGAGTSLEGHEQALQGGITIDLSQMNKVM